MTNDNDRLDYQAQQEQDERQQLEEQYERVCWEISVLEQRKRELRAEIGV